MSFANVRLTRELNKLNGESIDGVQIIPPENIRSWTATIDGPIDTPYQNFKFQLLLNFDDNYPVKPPSVKFISPIYHPNVYKDGKICVDILKNEWSPAQNIRTVLLSIRSLLMDPNPRSPANRDAAVIYNQSKELYAKKVIDFLTSNHTV
jgi:ubiquitin-protein ligase